MLQMFQHIRYCQLVACQQYQADQRNRVQWSWSWSQARSLINFTRKSVILLANNLWEFTVFDSTNESRWLAGSFSGLLQTSPAVCNGWLTDSDSWILFITCTIGFCSDRIGLLKFSDGNELIPSRLVLKYLTSSHRYNSERMLYTTKWLPYNCSQWKQNASLALQHIQEDAGIAVGVEPTSDRRDQCRVKIAEIRWLSSAQVRLKSEVF